MKRLIILCTIALSVSFANASDNRFELFHEAHKIEIEHKNQQAELIKKLDKELYDIWIQLPDIDTLYFKLEEIAFMAFLGKRNSQFWSNPYNWSSPIESTEQHKFLSNNNQDFKHIDEQFQTALKMRKEFINKTNLQKRMHKLVNNNSEEFDKIDSLFHEKLMELQNKMDYLID